MDDATNAAPAASRHSESSSLDPLGTNPHPLDRQSSVQARVHSPVLAVREKVITALHESDDERHVKRAAKIGLCCVAPLVGVAAGRLPRLLLGLCRDRLCPTCSRRRATRVRERLARLVCSCNAPRFLTLTAPDDDRPLSVRLDELMESFRNFRRTREWKDHVRGAVFVLEVTRNSNAGTWHPHLHVVADGEFWPQASLCSAWSRSCPGAKVVDIRACHDRVRTARYLSKYLAKDREFLAWSNEEVREYADAMFRRRVIDTCGKLRRVLLDPTDAEPDVPASTEALISVAELEAAIEQGVEPAKRAAPLLAQLAGTWRLVTAAWRKFGELPCPELTSADFDELRAWLFAYVSLRENRNHDERQVKRKPKPQSEGPPLFDHAYR